ncbi:hypothetical protein [Nocardia brasiliensis]|uniref:hypothetical protein n=1 Tax=Nocardia brasiliensis TaxID=37326 RepID=UPI003D8FFDB6
MQNELVANHRPDRPFTWQACSANWETLSVKAFPAEDHVSTTGSDALTLPSLTPCSVLLDPELRCPNHYRGAHPTAERGAAEHAADRPTGLHRHVRSLVDEFTTHYRRAKGRAPQFGPPCTTADLVAAEAAPADLGLHVLVLDAAQWARLWTADRVPERLAVAECVGDATLPQLTGWAAWLRAKVRSAAKAVAPQGNT